MAKAMRKIHVPAYWAREVGVQAVAYNGVVVEVVKVMGIGIGIGIDVDIAVEEEVGIMLMVSMTEEKNAVVGDVERRRSVWLSSRLSVLMLRAVRVTAILKLFLSLAF